MPKLAHMKLEEQREAVVRFIEQNRPQGSQRNLVTLVFDGQKDIFGQMISSGVDVIFARNETADDKIKKIVEQSQNPKNIIVVTDDRDIQYAVGALGARFEGVKEFFLRCEHKNKTVNYTKGDTIKVEKHISKNLEDKINQEMMNIWLNKNKKK